eukprot:139345-Amphidinium_carterae.1
MLLVRAGEAEFQAQKLQCKLNSDCGLVGVCLRTGGHSLLLFHRTLKRGQEFIDAAETCQKQTSHGSMTSLVMSWNPRIQVSGEPFKNRGRME